PLPRALTTGAHDAGPAENPPVNRLRTFDQAYDGRKLTDLKKPEQAGTVANARIAREAAQTGITLKPTDKPDERVAVEQRVAVRADEDFVLGQQCPDSESPRL